MFAWLTSWPNRAKAGELYGAVVTVARTPGYYSIFCVPDTPRGRFEVIALVLFLVLERLKDTPGGMALSQAAIEAFITDMDDCMREMGVGDLTVPKKVERAAAAFYDRAKDYRKALAENGDDALPRALLLHIWNRGDGVATEASWPLAQALANAIRYQVEGLACTKDARLLNTQTLVDVLQHALPGTTHRAACASQAVLKKTR